MGKAEGTKEKCNTAMPTAVLPLVSMCAWIMSHTYDACHMLTHWVVSHLDESYGSNHTESHII